jgi:poly-gamma-glutamate synthesis protein (capsule biosynthesis protein)
MIHSIETFNEAGLGHAGAGRTEIEADSPQLYQITRGGRTFTIAQISTTYGLNGLVLPADMQWAVHMNEIDEIIDRATRARAAGADMVFLSLHDGYEYHDNPNASQIRIATAMAESGVIDFVFGHHAHVPQRIELLPGGVDGNGMWVAYGLGNMLSNQFEATLARYGIRGAARTSQGLFAIATVTAEPGQPPRVTNMEWAAHTVCRDSGHRMHMLNTLLADPGQSQIPLAEVQYRDYLVRRVMDATHEDRVTAAERLTPPTPTGPPPVVVPRPE